MKGHCSHSWKSPTNKVIRMTKENGWPCSALEHCNQILRWLWEPIWTNTIFANLRNWLKFRISTHLICTYYYTYSISFFFQLMAQAYVTRNFGNRKIFAIPTTFSKAVRQEFVSPGLLSRGLPTIRASAQDISYQEFFGNLGQRNSFKVWDCTQDTLNYTLKNNFRQMVS